MNSSTKVMIDVKEGNNILYLPLDQIAAASLDPNRRSREDASSSTTATTLSSDIQEITDRVIEELRRRQDRR
jgi:membrane protease subunit HflK